MTNRLDAREKHRASAFSAHNISTAQKISDRILQLMRARKDINKSWLEPLAKESSPRFGVCPVPHAHIPVFFSKYMSDELEEKITDVFYKIAHDVANDKYQNVPTTIEVSTDTSMHSKIIWVCLSWHNAIVKN